MSSVDQKKIFNKLKHDLESFREIILFGNSILKWEKKFYPGVIFGIVSVVFLTLWYLDLSIITQIALTLLLTTLIDYLCPILSKLVFKADNWTGAHESKFEEVCNELCTTHIKLIAYFNYIFVTKEEKSTVFVISVSLILVVLAWLGSIVNNLFLCYITVLGLLLYPGLQHHGFIGTVKGKFGSMLSSKLQQLREKATKSE